MDGKTEISLALLAWSLTMMRHAFSDLAVAFARIDRTAALHAINLVEKMVVADLTKLRDEPIQGINVPVEALVTLAQNFREITQGAVRDIDKANQPH
jgi:hypothetical protein